MNYAAIILMGVLAGCVLFYQSDQYNDNIDQLEAEIAQRNSEFDSLIVRYDSLESFFNESLMREDSLVKLSRTKRQYNEEKKANILRLNPDESIRLFTTWTDSLAR